MIAAALSEAEGAQIRAVSLTGWEASALGLPVGAVFELIDRWTHRPDVNPVVKALYKEMVVPIARHVLLTRDGEERQIRDTASPIHDPRGPRRRLPVGRPRCRRACHA